MASRRIPLLDARGAAHPAAATAAAQAADVAAILAIARRRHTAAGLRLGDALSRRWLARNASPLGPEIAAVARQIGSPGAWLLNLSYEWACTCGIEATGEPVMLRVLDWPMEGLGEALCVIRQAGPAGEWWHVGWPGLAGTITALAPGRFAAAINQPPLPLTRLGAAARARGLGLAGIAADWLASRPALWRSRALPPAHLLRVVCDTAPDFGTALAMLRDTPLAAPVAFTLAGTRPGEAVCIERTPDGQAQRRGPRVAMANHWDGLGLPGAARWMESGTRQAMMAGLLEAGPPEGLAWLRPPLVNRGTRLAAVMRPAAGRLSVAGFAGERQVTALLHLAAGGADPARRDEAA
ncbi:C45 family peptidase [Falsiroseomonas ponticola]|uniref:hypothetical protein n=1 Tax=Falsiroseomonas ponticola TaxID=2786951 RepID=UPI001932F989|nr:hypothetical protein [Roseomonas ponticola]